VNSPQTQHAAMPIPGTVLGPVIPAAAPEPVRSSWPVDGRGAAIYFLLLSLPVAVGSYYSIFNGFPTSYDDEGMLMMSVKQYLAGFKLYDQIFSGYGPLYYFYNWFIRFVTDTAVTNDTTRMTSAVIWVLCPLIGAWIVFRYSRSLPLAAVAHVLVFRHLAVFRLAPGHPQELCVLLFTGLAATSLLADRPRGVRTAMISAGTIAAALLLIKVNVGIFVILGVTLAALSESPLTVLSGVARAAAVAAALALPAVLMRVHLDDPPERVFCLVLMASTAALLPGLFGRSRRGSLSFGDCWTAVAAFAATIAAAWLVLAAQGVSSWAILDSLVLANLRVNVQSRWWYTSLPFTWIWIPWALAGLAAALLFARAPRRTDRLLGPLKLIIGAGSLLVAVIRFEFLAPFVAPYCWLLLYPPSADAQSSSADFASSPGFARSVLAATAILHTLYSYPASLQNPVFVLLTLVGAVLLGDFLTTVAPRATAGAPRLLRASALVVLLAIPLYYSSQDYVMIREYNRLPSLALPGAERIHLSARQADDFQWLTSNLRAHCDVFMGMPNILSLNFWTGIDSPTGLNAGNWMEGLTAEQQLEVEAAFDKHPDACVVYMPWVVSFMERRNPTIMSQPLAQYIVQHFKVAGVMDVYYLLARKERDLSIPSGP
jgi:hypothetical protein